MYAPYKKPTQTFGNVRYPILDKPSTPMYGLVDRHGRKADKLKISYMADNANIIRSQARDTKHRGMQGISSLCTDSRRLQDEYCIVGILYDIPHSTSSSSMEKLHESLRCPWRPQFLATTPPQSLVLLSSLNSSFIGCRSIDKMNANCLVPPTNMTSKQLSFSLATIVTHVTVRAYVISFGAGKR